MKIFFYFLFLGRNHRNKSGGSDSPDQQSDSDEDICLSQTGGALIRFKKEGFRVKGGYLTSLQEGKGRQEVLQL